MRTSTGLSTEVAFIFSNMLRKLTRTYEPQYMAAVFESLGKTPVDPRPGVGGSGPGGAANGPAQPPLAAPKPPTTGKSVDL